MTRPAVRTEGFRELENALRDIEKVATRRTIARRALQEAGAPILDLYRALTTVVTGALFRSEVIGTRLNKRQTRLNRADKSPVEVHIGTNDPAGLQEEFGLRNQAANPALQTAWDQQGGEKALPRIGKSLWSEIEKAAQRAARRALRRR